MCGFDPHSSPEVFSLEKKSQDLYTSATVNEHIKWLDDIRQTIWYRTKIENEMVASDDALMLHWKRTCWIVHVEPSRQFNHEPAPYDYLWMDNQ